MLNWLPGGVATQGIGKDEFVSTLTSNEVTVQAELHVNVTFVEHPTGPGTAETSVGTHSTERNAFTLPYPSSFERPFVYV